MRGSVMANDDLLTTKEAAKLLRLSPRTLQNHRARQTGPLYTHHGRRVFYRRTDVENWSHLNRKL